MRRWSALQRTYVIFVVCIFKATRSCLIILHGKRNCIAVKYASFIVPQLQWLQT